MAHTFTSLTVHIVFSTKNRQRFIDADLKHRLLPYLGGTIRSHGGHLLRANTVEDHVHLLIDLPSTLSIAELVGKIKGSSSKWIHDTWQSRKTFGWQKGYGAFSVSQSNVPAVVRYIDAQEEHHRRRSFEEEFLNLLKRHRIEYDERFLWR